VPGLSQVEISLVDLIRSDQRMDTIDLAQIIGAWATWLEASMHCGVIWSDLTRRVICVGVGGVEAGCSWAPRS
jgi:hypothetical protein